MSQQPRPSESSEEPPDPPARSRVLPESIFTVQAVRKVSDLERDFGVIIRAEASRLAEEEMRKDPSTPAESIPEITERHVRVAFQQLVLPSRDWRSMISNSLRIAGPVVAGIGGTLLAVKIDQWWWGASVAALGVFIIVARALWARPE